MTKPINSLHLRALHDAVTRLYFVTLGFNLDRLYPRTMHQDPEIDQDLLIDLIEGARNEWRPLWRGRGIGNLESLQAILRWVFPDKPQT